MDAKQRLNLYLKVKAKYGMDVNVRKLGEEATELALATYRILERGKLEDWDNFYEEIADVEIKIEHIKLTIGGNISHEIDKWKKLKLDRLAKRVAE